MPTRFYVHFLFWQDWNKETDDDFFPPTDRSVNEILFSQLILLELPIRLNDV